MVLSVIAIIVQGLMNPQRPSHLCSRENDMLKENDILKLGCSGKRNYSFVSVVHFTTFQNQHTFFVFFLV